MKRRSVVAMKLHIMTAACSTLGKKLRVLVAVALVWFPFPSLLLLLLLLLLLRSLLVVKRVVLVRFCSPCTAEHWPSFLVPFLTDHGGDSAGYSSS